MRVLFIHNALTTFVRADRDILAGAHEVDELDLAVPGRIASLPRRLVHADVVYVWFASLHSLLPVLSAAALRRPVLVAVGGYDTAAMPEIGYGSMAHPWKKHAVRSICNAASGLVANSRAARDEVKRNTGTRTPIHMIYHGFCPSNGPGPLPRQDLVLSVGNVSRESLLRKGHELFVRAAALVPDARFVLAGRIRDDAGRWLRSFAPANVELTGYIAHGDLAELYHRASVYVQPSAHEGFGCAVAEAMQAGCMPVVSRAGALPEVVGPCGVIVDTLNERSLAAGIRQALGATPSDRRDAADRIDRCFPLSLRRERLLRLVDEVARA